MGYLFFSPNVFNTVLPYIMYFNKWNISELSIKQIGLGPMLSIVFSIGSSGGSKGRRAHSHPMKIMFCQTIITYLKNAGQTSVAPPFSQITYHWYSQV